MKSNFWHNLAIHQDTDTIYYVFHTARYKLSHGCKVAEWNERLKWYRFFFFYLVIHCTGLLSSLCSVVGSWWKVWRNECAEGEYLLELEVISIMNLSRGLWWGDWQKMEWCNKRVNNLPWETGSCWKMNLNMTQEIRHVLSVLGPIHVGLDWNRLLFVFGIVNGKWSGGSIMAMHREREIAHLRYMTQLIETIECPLSVQ